MKKLEEMEKISRRQINIRLELELYDFLVKYSRENYKTVTAVVREMIADLYKENKVQLVVKSNKE
jgi:predicted DNA-binding protein